MSCSDTIHGSAARGHQVELCSPLDDYGWQKSGKRKHQVILGIEETFLSGLGLIADFKSILTVSLKSGYYIIETAALSIAPGRCDASYSRAAWMFLSQFLRAKRARVHAELRGHLGKWDVTVL
jgi:hypothetical protein